jgi:hypothetical protein
MSFANKPAALRITLLLAIPGYMSIIGFAQQSSVRVGVAVMQNYAGRSVPGNLERDRLVKALNQLKPDKKTHMKVEAVPLNGSSADEVGDEAQQKGCEYVVYTKLTELRNQTDPYQHMPGTIETNPNSQWTAPPEEPEYRATVEWKLAKVGSPGVIDAAPFSTQQTGNEIDTVSQVMDQIALRVADIVKKGAPPMKE